MPALFVRTHGHPPPSGDPSPFDRAAHGSGTAGRPRDQLAASLSAGVTSPRYHARMLTMRPQSSEFGEFYAGYVGRVPDGRWLERLQAQPADLRALVGGVDDDRAALPMAAGKWSLLDVLTHVTDAERVFAFRLLWIARGDTAELPGFDQDAWARIATTLRRTVAQSLDEFAALRQSTLALLDSLPDEAADRRAVVNGHEITVRALAWIIPGHVQHHLELLATWAHA